MQEEHEQAQRDLATYLVNNSLLKANTHGLAYRSRKSVGAITGKVIARWGEVVHGVEAGDGWLKVGSNFLPMQVDGKVVVTRTSESIYLVDNSQLQADTKGIVYRLRKDLNAKLAPQGSNVARFNTYVTGIEEDGSWLRVRIGHQCRFLPITLDGKRILVKDVGIASS